MSLRISLALLLCASLVYAEPSTRPTTRPSTQPAKYPTPTELMEKIKQKRKTEASQLKVAYIDLRRPVSERPNDFSIFANDDATSLRSIVDRLHKARDDKSLRGVLLTLSSDAS